MSVESNLVETVDYSPWVSARNCDFGKNDIFGKGISRGAEWQNF